MSRELIHALKEKDCMVFMAITGGGTGAINTLLENGGASSVFLGAEVPYGYWLTPDYAGEPKKYVALQYAYYLAEYSLTKSVGIIKDFKRRQPKYLIGLGCTAALYKEGQREGRENAARICVLTYGKQHDTMVDLSPVWPRKAQEIKLAEDILFELKEFVDAL